MPCELERKQLKLLLLLQPYHSLVFYVLMHKPRHRISFCAYLTLLLPFRRTLIDKDVSIAPETFRKHVDTSLTYINRALKYMTRLFLVEDLVDSLKVSTSCLQLLSIIILSIWLVQKGNYSASVPGRFLSLEHILASFD